MRADVRLGIRLAVGGAAAEQFRAGAMVLATACGSLLLLGTVAAVRSGAAPGFSTYDAAGMQRLLATVVTVVAVSVVVLVATAARLSASVRDRRLAGLRLLGLSPARTRIVAAVESGVGAAVGSVTGLALFLVVRPMASRLDAAGRDWSATSFTPWPLAAVAVVVGVPAVAVGVALVPTRSFGREPAMARLETSRRPSSWRLLPLGVGLLAMSVVHVPGTDSSDPVVLSVLLIGGTLCGLSGPLVVPVLTRLLADLLVRVPGRPALRIAGRRLQAQPAGVSRVVAGLVIGLFVVTGGRMVVGAFEDTSQYAGAARAIEGGQAPYQVMLPARVDAEVAAQELASLDGARGAYVERTVRTSCRRTAPCLTAFVGSCADVDVMVAGTTGCVDGTPAWLGPTGARWVGDASALVWRGGRERVRLPVPSTTIALPSGVAPDAGLDASVFLPETTPGLTDLVDGRAPVVAVVDPIRSVVGDLRAAVDALAPSARAYPLFSRADYNFVAGLRSLVWAVAAVVLGLGLLGYVIAAVDRAIGRRAEMVSLQLIGTPRRVIRAAQWWEAVLPLAFGVGLAVLLGWAVGTAYLAVGDSVAARPWQFVLGLAGVGVAAALGVAGLTVVGCAPRIRPDLVRRT